MINNFGFYYTQVPFLFTKHKVDKHFSNIFTTVDINNEQLGKSD